jgi:hypothetical protein
MRVHRDGHSHKKSIAVRFASLFSWRFYLYISWEANVTKLFRETYGISWESTVTKLFRETCSILWEDTVMKLFHETYGISWELSVMELFHESYGIFMRVTLTQWNSWEFKNLTGNIVFHESTPSQKYVQTITKGIFSWESMSVMKIT